MKRSKLIILSVIQITLFLSFSKSQEINSNLFSKKWDANWVIPTKGLYIPQCKGVYNFRKEFFLDEVSKTFIIHIAADQQYRLFVNGNYVSYGNVHGDVASWQFDSFDIAKYLKKGTNVIAVEVWSYNTTPWAQLTLRTALIVQGNSEIESIINTNQSWQVKPDYSRTFLEHDFNFFNQLTGVGNCEKYVPAKSNNAWKLPNFSDSNFIAATPIEQGIPKQINTSNYYWSLVPRSIPLMEEKTQQFKNIVSKQNVLISNNFLKGDQSITISANTNCSVIFDQSYVTTAFPVLNVSQGKDASIQLIYSENTYNKELEKNPLFNSEYNLIRGYYDYFLPDGTENCIFRPLRFRTFRYIQMNIVTKDEPLIIQSFNSIFTAYPFELKGSFTCNDTILNKIFEVGWRTARLCAHDTYYDCPYYEQLQYFGDLSIYNPITVLLSGDARLLKNAILYGNNSRLNNDLTMCAYPSNEPKIIPAFSLYWIEMLNKYILFTGDSEFGKQMMPGVENVLKWFGEKLNENNLLGSIPFWNFIDCTKKWSWIEDIGQLCDAPCAKTGNSTILTLQYIYGLQSAANVYNNIGNKTKADSIFKITKLLQTSILKHCWDNQRKLLIDCPTERTFSQHSNIFGLITNTIPSEYENDVIESIVNDNSLIQASTQFKSYLHAAFVKCKRTDLYFSSLKTWENLIHEGFTTFPEYPHKNSRSYCHAWSACPTYEFINIICGIKLIKPNFEEILIEPEFGILTNINGSLPTPKGMIETKYLIKNKKIFVQIIIPDGTKALFRWKKMERNLFPGINKFEMENSLSDNR